VAILRQGCECLYVFFWSWISHCGDNFSDDDGLSCFYVYYTLRWIMVLRSSCGALHKSGRYHRAEKGLRTKAPLSKEQAAQLSRKQYRESLATISSSHLLYAVYAITSMVAAEITIQDFGLQASSSVYSVGQIIAIIIAGSTVIRTSWVFIGIWNEEDTKGFPDLVFTLLRDLSSYLKPLILGGADAEDGEARPPSGAPSPPLTASPYAPASGLAGRPAQLFIGSEEADADAGSVSDVSTISMNPEYVSDMSEDGEAQPPPSPSSVRPPLQPPPAPDRRPARRRVNRLSATAARPQLHETSSTASAPPQLELHDDDLRQESRPALTQPPSPPSPQPQHEHRLHIPLNRPDIFHSPPQPVTPQHMRPNRDTPSYRFTFRNPFRSAGRNLHDSDDDEDDDEDNNARLSWISEV